MQALPVSPEAVSEVEDDLVVKLLRAQIERYQDQLQLLKNFK